MGLSELGSKLVEPARWIVIMGIAFTLANTVLFFIAPPERSGAANPSARQTARTPDTRPAVSINAILNRNLFGIAGETAVAETGLPAVETRLPLELLGVFVADVDAESAAIIAQKGKAGGHEHLQIDIDAEPDANMKQESIDIVDAADLQVVGEQPQ